MQSPGRKPEREAFTPHGCVVLSGAERSGPRQRGQRAQAGNAGRGPGGPGGRRSRFDELDEPTPSDSPGPSCGCRISRPHERAGRAERARARGGIHPRSPRFGFQAFAHFGSPWLPLRISKLIRCHRPLAKKRVLIGWHFDFM